MTVSSQPSKKFWGSDALSGASPSPVVAEQIVPGEEVSGALALFGDAGRLFWLAHVLRPEVPTYYGVRRR